MAVTREKVIADYKKANKKNPDDKALDKIDRFVHVLEEIERLKLFLDKNGLDYEVREEGKNLVRRRRPEREQFHQLNKESFDLYVNLGLDLIHR
ncbi:hypothetical protein ABXV18_27185 [Vibrio owensii]|uniref:hypothetical protein n=1 Tax=Vibrio owensii TaxID=696485 RepID=UPI003396029C